MDSEARTLASLSVDYRFDDWSRLYKVVLAPLNRQEHFEPPPSTSSTTSPSNPPKQKTNNRRPDSAPPASPSISLSGSKRRRNTTTPLGSSQQPHGRRTGSRGCSGGKGRWCAVASCEWSRPGGFCWGREGNVVYSWMSAVIALTLQLREDIAEEFCALYPQENEPSEYGPLTIAKIHRGPGRVPGGPVRRRRQGRSRGLD